VCRALKILLLNQTFHPDVMASAQYLTQLACALAERRHEVTVVTSRRAYDQPATQFPAQETWRGIKIHRVASTAFGKGAKWRRAADFASFIVSCCARLALLPRQDVVVALTSPPLISFIGACLARWRGRRFVYWVMDFNPDEAIAAGWLRPRSLAARMLERMSRFSLRRAHRVVALDRFMRDRIAAKEIPAEKVVVIPPWSQDDQVSFDPAGRERFRVQHGWQDKFVVMYSGNHSPIHPLDTLLEAAKRLEGERDVVFCFIGGGSEFQRVQALAGQGRGAGRPATVEPGGAGKTGEESRMARPIPGQTAPPAARPEHYASNIVCLPYQPLELLSASLSAADAQVVVMGNAFVGLVHPCKIYNILGVGAPVLYVGPQPSHVTEILAALPGEPPFACVQHGDVEGLVQGIQSIRKEASKCRRPAPESGHSRFSKGKLLPELIDVVESK
jgi:colanic acid biosynthesis glycosyl transferase WcaI